MTSLKNHSNERSRSEEKAVGSASLCGELAMAEAIRTEDLR